MDDEYKSLGISGAMREGLDSIQVGPVTGTLADYGKRFSLDPPRVHITHTTVISVETGDGYRDHADCCTIEWVGTSVTVRQRDNVVHFGEDGLHIKALWGDLHICDECMSVVLRHWRPDRSGGESGG